MSTRKTSLSASPLATAAPPAGGDIARPLTTQNTAQLYSLFALANLCIARRSLQTAAHA